ncbi:hypothetical protein Tco_1547675 [Tanacetum coccineum]
MDILSKVSEYLNELENMLDDGDSTMKMEELIEVGKAELEKVDAMDTLVTKEVATEKMKREVVVFTKAPPREYYEPFMRKMVRDVRVEIHGFDFHVDFVVLEYGDEGEPSVMFGRNFLVATKSQVDFGLGEMQIDIMMLKEDRDVDIVGMCSCHTDIYTTRNI